MHRRQGELAGQGHQPHAADHRRDRPGRLPEGEGDGVDLGYNIAQSIGFVAMYGLLTNAATYVDAAARLLETHGHFMYPSGAIDNSWGTRSYKWMLESGTKTAPGIYFTYGLLAHVDPAFNRGAQLALGLLRQVYLAEPGWMVYGPDAHKHPGSNPPSNYPTFARAQSIATVVELGTEAAALAPIPAENEELDPAMAVDPHRRGADRQGDGHGHRLQGQRALPPGIGGARGQRHRAVVRGVRTDRVPAAVVPHPLHAGGGQAHAHRGAAAAVDPAHRDHRRHVQPPTCSMRAPRWPPRAPRALGGDHHRAAAHLAGAASATTFRWTHRFGAELLQQGGGGLVRRAASKSWSRSWIWPATSTRWPAADTFRIQTASAGTWELKVEMSSGPYRPGGGKRPRPVLVSFSRGGGHPAGHRPGRGGGRASHRPLHRPANGGQRPMRRNSPEVLT